VVPVTDLAIRDNDLVAATAGRAFWILDDLGAIQQSQQSAASNTLKVFTPKAAYRYGNGSDLMPPPPGAAVGQNAPEGVIIDYHVPDIPFGDTLFMDILDAKGKVVRTYSSRPEKDRKTYPGGPRKEPVLPASKGMNRFLWDFRTGTVSPDVEGVYIYGDYRGHRLAPGDYAARIRTGSQSSTASFKVLQDPRLQSTASDWQEQQAFLSGVNADIGEMHTDVNELRKVRTRLEEYDKSLSDDTATTELRAKGRYIIGQIDLWESDIVETRIRNGQDVINWPSRLNAEFFNLKGLADAHDPKITAGMKERLADLESKWREKKRELGAIRSSVGEYNELHRKSGTPAIRYR
jgi:hypothetical protein